MSNNILYNKKDDNLTFYIPLKSNCKIHINQAFCHLCNTNVLSGHNCKCGNLEVFGDNTSLGRKVKNLHP